MDLGQCELVDETAFVMAAFRPGIGIKQKDTGQNVVFQHGQDLASVTIENPNICQVFCLNRAEQLGDTADKGLATDEPDAWVVARLPCKMFAAAKAYLEPDVFNAAIKQPFRPANPRVGRIDPQLRQEVFNQLGLMGAKPRPLATAIEPALRR